LAALQVAEIGIIRAAQAVMPRHLQTSLVGFAVLTLGVALLHGMESVIEAETQRLLIILTIPPRVLLFVRMAAVQALVGVEEMQLSRQVRAEQT